MRLTRRALLAGAAAATLPGPARARPVAAAEPTSIAIKATAIETLSAAQPERRSFGALTFRSGLQLTSDFEGFGGFSGLWRAPGGDEIVALTDNTQWLTARIVSAGGRMTGVADAVIAPVLARDGRPLRRTRSYDTEGLAVAGGVAYVAIERSQEVMRFNWGKDGVRARAQPVPVPEEAKDLPRNQGLEAIGVAPPRRAARRRRRRHRRAGGRIDRGPDPRLRPQRAAPGRFRCCARRRVRRHRPRLPAVGRDAAARAARVLPQRVRGAPPAHPGRGDRAGRHRRRSRHLRGRFRQPDRQHGGIWRCIGPAPARPSCR